VEADLDKLVGFEITKNRDIDLLRYNYRRATLKEIDQNPSATAFANLDTSREKNLEGETPRPFFAESLQNKA